jgi:tRNA dimethylallyltransferase
MPSPTNDQSKNSHTRVKPLVVLLGPTAVGKTELAITLAENLNGEIISADSRLYYRGMDIGTDKPSKDDRARIEHHLIDVSEPDDVWSLARFQKAANQAIQDIHSRSKLPFLVGGTGQYIRAVIEGWEIPKVKPRPGLRRALERWAEKIGEADLHRRLVTLDPDGGEKIDPTNLRRTIRALEVIFSTGDRFSEQKRRSSPPYNIMIIGLNRPRTELYSRVDMRIDTMIENGLIEEVQNLLDAGYSKNNTTLSAIGYIEIIDYLEGNISLPDAIREMKRKTRNFVRRQANWFKADDPDINWFWVKENVAEELIIFIRDWFRTLDKNGMSRFTENNQ